MGTDAFLRAFYLLDPFARQEADEAYNALGWIFEAQEKVDPERTKSPHKACKRAERERDEPDKAAVGQQQKARVPAAAEYALARDIGYRLHRLHQAVAQKHPACRPRRNGARGGRDNRVERVLREQGVSQDVP